MKNFLVLLSIPFLFIACDIDIAAPEIVSVNPIHGISVEADTVISISFSEQMDRDSVEKSFTLASDNGLMEGSWTWENNNQQCSFTPEISLENGMSYSISIDRSASDMKGNVLKSRYYSTFTVGQDITPPTVISTTPENNSITFPLNSTIEVEFSETMDRMSVERNMKISPSIEGTFTWTGSTRVVFTPSKPLEFNTDYSLIIPVDCTDAAGNHILQRKEVFFTAGEEFIKPVIETITSDSIINWLDSPVFTVIENVERTDSITFTFSEAVNRQSFIDSLKIFPEVDRYYLWPSNNSCIVNFVKNLTPMEEYELRIISGTKDLAGNEMEGTIIYSFLVNGPGSQPPVIQSIELFKTSDDPDTTDDDSDTLYNTDIFNNTNTLNEINGSLEDDKGIKARITFSKAVDVTSFFENISIDFLYGPYSESTGTKKSFVWNESQTVFTILFTSMNNINTYSLSIKGNEGGLKSEDGIYLKDDFISYFYFNGGI